MPFARHGTFEPDAWRGRAADLGLGFGFGLGRAGFPFDGAAVVGVVRTTEAVGGAVFVDAAGCGADDLCPEQAASANANAMTARAADQRSRMRRVRLTARLV